MSSARAGPRRACACAYRRISSPWRGRVARHGLFPAGQLPFGPLVAPAAACPNQPWWSGSDVGVCAEGGCASLQVAQRRVRDLDERSSVFRCCPAPFNHEQMRSGNRWPAGHTLDVGHLYRLALEDAPAGTRGHAVGGEGIPLRDIAQSIGDPLGIPTASIPDDRLQAHFGFLAMVISLDNPVSNLVTRKILGWEPAHPGLIADFDHGDYFTAPSPHD